MDRAEALKVTHDSVSRFFIEPPNFYGRIIKLSTLMNDILTRHNYPEPISRLLGEALMAVTLIGSGLKFSGKLILQLQDSSSQKTETMEAFQAKNIQTEQEHDQENINAEPCSGGIKFLVVEYISSGGLRGYVKLSEKEASTKKKKEESTTNQSQYSLKSLFKTGILVLTLVPDHGGERYQGIIHCTQNSLAEVIQSYFSQSEQTPTRIHLAVGQNFKSGKTPEWQGGGLIMQNYPEIEGSESLQRYENQEEDYWKKATTLLESMTDAELIEHDLSAGVVLYRLFHEDGIKIMPPQYLSRFCTCNKDHISMVLNSFKPEEKQELVKDGLIETKCEYCQDKFTFTSQELAKAKLQK